MSNIFKKFLQFAFGSGIALILGLCSSPIISRLISPVESGVFTQFNTVASLLCLIILVGYDQAYARFFYEEDEKVRNGLLKECLRIPLRIWALVATISLIFYMPISNFISGKTDFELVVLLVFHILFCIVLSFALLVIRMKQRGKIFSAIQILTKATYISFFLAMYVIFKDKYWSLVLGLFLSNLFVLVFALWIEKIEWRAITKKVQIKTNNKKIFNYAFPLVFASTISWLLSSVNNIFIRKYSTFNELGIYGQAFSIISLLIAFQSAFSTFWVPTANEKYINNPEDKEFFAKINSYVVVGMFTLGILFIGFKDIIIYLLGEEFRTAKYIIPFLAFMPIMSTISEVTGVGISFKKKTKYNIVIALIAAITNVIGNFLLVPVLGGKGAAISVGISYIIYFIVRTLFSVRLYKIDYRLKSFSIVVISVLLFAGYSTFNSLDIVIVAMTIANLILLVVLYRDIVKELLLIIKNITIKRKNK
jgi:O-antigen/teichoic acid export membrane protein